MQWLLIPFGWLYIIAMFLAIVVPYLRGRADLLTPWTLFLLGSANFIGYAAVQSGNAESFQQYDYNTDATYLWFIAGAMVYTVAAFAAYYWFHFPTRAAGRTFRRWVGSDSTAVLVLLLSFCAALSLGTVLYPNIQFFGQIVSMMGQAAGPIAMTLAFVALLRQPYNPVVWAIFVITLLLTFGISMAAGTGRRSLLSTAMAFPVVAYWLWARYRSAASNVIVAALLGGLIFITLAAYTSIRHRHQDDAPNPVAHAIGSLKMMPAAMMGMGNTRILGGDAVEASLAAINTYGVRKPHEPFFTVYYVLGNPIPRAFWPSKPIGLGARLPYDCGWGGRNHGLFNWGPGIVGHGFHEGGLHMLLFYGLLSGIAFRYADELLRRQHDNAILLGVFAAASGQIVGLVRGEFGLFIVLIIAACLTGWVVNAIGRIFFGTGRVYPTPEEEMMMGYGGTPGYFAVDPEGMYGTY